MRGRLIDYSKGDDLHRYWKLFRRRERTENKGMRDFLTFCLNRMAHRHGGYIGNGAQIRGIPSLPHGLHGVYISRYASIGEGCRIYQNVTIGEVEHRRRLPDRGRSRDHRRRYRRESRKDWSGGRGFF